MRGWAYLQIKKNAMKEHGLILRVGLSAVEYGNHFCVSRPCHRECLTVLCW